MFTDDGRKEFEKHAKWISDENFDLIHNFDPDADTPKEAVEYYIYMMSELVDFDDPNFSWPTGVGMCL